MGKADSVAVQPPADRMKGTVHVLDPANTLLRSVKAEVWEALTCPGSAHGFWKGTEVNYFRGHGHTVCAATTRSAIVSQNLP